MRKTLIAALLAAGLAAPGAAQNAPAPAQAQQAQPNQQVADTPQDRARAAVIFRTFSIALNSNQVQQAVKNQLVSCLYNNPIRNISVATGRAFARNTGLDATKPEQVYAVAARLCGVTAQQEAAQATPAPAPTPPAQTGR